MGNAELGIRLKQARGQSGMKQADVCEAVGIPKIQTLSAYERGINSPPIETLKNLSRLYGVSTDWLLFGECYAPLKEKTPRDYVEQLVDAVDHLKIDLESRFESYTNDSIVVLNLFSSPYEGMNSFIVKWERLRKLLDEEIIEQDDYNGLMKQKLNDLALHERTNNLSYIDSYDTQELPF